MDKQGTGIVSASGTNSVENRHFGKSWVPYDYLQGFAEMLGVAKRVTIFFYS